MPLQKSVFGKNFADMRVVRVEAFAEAFRVGRVVVGPEGEGKGEEGEVERCPGLIGGVRVFVCVVGLVRRGGWELVEKNEGGWGEHTRSSICSGPQLHQLMIG
jgi:hypothetical protein